MKIFYDLGFCLALRRSRVDSFCWPVKSSAPALICSDIRTHFDTTAFWHARLEIRDLFAEMLSEVLHSLAVMRTKLHR